MTGARNASDAAGAPAAATVAEVPPAATLTDGRARVLERARRVAALATLLGLAASVFGALAFFTPLFGDDNEARHALVGFVCFGPVATLVGLSLLVVAHRTLNRRQRRAQNGISSSSGAA